MQSANAVPSWVRLSSIAPSAACTVEERTAPPLKHGRTARCLGGTLGIIGFKERFIDLGGYHVESMETGQADFATAH